MEHPVQDTDLLVQVLQRVPTQQRMTSAALVCSSWDKAATLATSSMKAVAAAVGSFLLKADGSLEALHLYRRSMEFPVPETFSKLTSLCVEGCTVTSLATTVLAAHMPALQSVALQGCRLCHDSVLPPLHHITGLTRLTLHGVDVSQAALLPASLVDVEFAKTSAPPPLQHLTGLTRLAVDAIGPDFIPPNSLRDLSLSHSAHLPPLQHLTGLTRLAAAHCSNLGPVGALLPDTVANLTIQGEPRPPGGGSYTPLADMLSSMSRLTSLCVSGAFRLPTQLPGALAHLAVDAGVYWPTLGPQLLPQRLTYLSVAGCTTTWAMRRMSGLDLSMLTELRRLTLSGPWDFLATGQGRLPTSLTYLHVYYERPVSLLSTLPLQQALQHLLVLRLHSKPHDVLDGADLSRLIELTVDGASWYEPLVVPQGSFASMRKLKLAGKTHAAAMCNVCCTVQSLVIDVALDGGFWPALSRCRHLTELHLRMCMDGAQHDPAAARALTTSSSLVSLRVVVVSSHSLDLQHMFGGRVLPHLTQLDLVAEACSGDVGAVLTACGSLRTLDLSTNIDSAGVAQLPRLPAWCSHLHTGGPGVTDAAVAALSRLTQLRELGLTRTATSSEALRGLTHLTGLRVQRAQWGYAAHL